MPRASLAMYDMLAPVQAANDLLWAGVRDRLRVAGIAAPDGLDRTISYHDIWLEPDLLLAQACGYPFVRQLQGKVRLVATPVYSFAGGRGTERTSFVVVRDTDAGEDLQAFRGRRVAINDPMSNSGMNLLRAAMAPLAGGKAYFSEVVVTGGHLPSIAAVRVGAADIAAIDTVTWGLLERHAPEMLSGLRILAATPSGPGLPLITSLSTSDAALNVLRFALADAIADRDLAPATEALGLTGLEILDEEDYARLSQLGDEASRLGYPIIA
jgi:ABC-type phosphate/phosphonate transport system substrate-binding protein